MLILPLPARPDWTRPPLATLSIMLLCLIAFLMQGGDAERAEAARRYYQQSGLAGTEGAAYRAELGRRDGGEGRASAQRNDAALLQEMEADRDFMQALRMGRVITSESPDYPTWRAQRAHYETLRARVLTERFALEGQQPRPATLLTHMFLHGDILHLSGNMAVLFVVGYTVEAALGPLGFLALYLLGGLGAALPDLLLPATGHHLSLGASGAISAVMAAYLGLFGRRRIEFFYWLLFFFGTVRGPALAILPLWLGNELLQNFVLDRDGNVNYLAHFAGLISGALLIALYRWRRHGRSAELVHRQDAEQVISALRARAEKHVAAMQFGLAALQYRKMFDEHEGVSAKFAAEYWRVARLARQVELESDARRRILEAAAADPQTLNAKLLGEVLDGDASGLPALTPGQWEALTGGLIDAGELDVAERLVQRFFPRPEQRAIAVRLAGRLGRAFDARGLAERAAPLRRLLAAVERPR
ncbi:rhomboid family intramembrane serine protease [Aromatoleum toluclasticum]|uniref:rhomboid family intramembrane serine protease n=1 Tax=Aromatoleum toluclasticum TaxID=92003 RepID=UPI001D1883B2|nr:rhomboid family intramembrane serine protease [Aromatoleum toluclasticum]MCC4114472.1 rhomboid family intramembrane serine protease [Aromatoleum toluclasticum]